jgi:hypothetical protein
MFVDPSLQLLKESILIQGAAVVAFASFVAAVQFIALRRLFANGG